VNELFIRLYLDEDVDVLIGALLRARGFDAVTTVDRGNLGKMDEEQLAYATSAGLALLTHNRADFEKLAAERFTSGSTHGGIVITVRRPAHEIARRLLVILNSVTAEEMRDQVRYL
jgi:predicted nuclease of predicted toxin-antitoxin system